METLIAFGHDIFTLSLALLAPVVAAALVAFLIRLAQKYGLEIDAERQARLEKTIQDLLLRVEEWARYQEKRTGQRSTSREKQIKFSDLAGVLNLTPDQVIALRDQELPKVRGLLGTNVLVSADGSTTVELER